MQQDAGNSTALSVLAPRINHVLIDHENVQPTSLGMLDRPDIRVWIFVGALQTKTSVELAITAKNMGERAQYVVVEEKGRNALDFVLAYHLGTLAQREPDAYFHIISKDTGFDPLVRQLRSQKLHAHRAEAVEQLVIFPQKARPKPLAVVVPSPAAAQGSAPSVAKASGSVASGADAKLAPAAANKATATAPAPPTPTPPKSAMNAAQRLAHIKDNLSRNKQARPAKKATLRNHVMAQFQKAISQQQADELIASLSKAGVLKLEGEKVRYC